MFKMLENLFGMGGTKTWMAVVLYVLCEGMKKYAPDMESLFEAFEQMFVYPLGVIGVAHKIERAVK